jgi:hypothetical protein
MYFLVNENKDVVARCKEEKDIYKTVMNFMGRIVKAIPEQCSTWDAVDKAGWWYLKKDKDYILREYYAAPGYFFNSFQYEKEHTLRISFFDGKLKSDIKANSIELVKLSQNKQVS